MCGYYQKTLAALPPETQPILPTALHHHQISTLPEVFVFQPVFPPLEDYKDIQTHTNHVWKIKIPVDKSRHITQAEAAMNWQAQNSVAQNHALHQILEEQKTITSMVTPTMQIVTELQQQIKLLHQELIRVATNSQSIPNASAIIAQKEAEKRSLEVQLKSIQHQQSSSLNQPSSFTNYFSSSYIPNYHPQPLIFPQDPLIYKPQPYPHHPFPQTSLQLSQPPPVPPIPKPRSTRTPPPSPPPPRPPQSEPEASASSTPPPTFLTIQKPNPISSFLRASCLKDSPKSPTQKSEADWTSQQMDEFDFYQAFDSLMMHAHAEEETPEVVEPEPIIEDPPENVFPEHFAQPHAHVPNDVKHLFNLDHLPPSQWHDKFMEMLNSKFQDSNCQMFCIESLLDFQEASMNGGLPLLSTGNSRLYRPPL